MAVSALVARGVLGPAGVVGVVGVVEGALLPVVALPASAVVVWPVTVSVVVLATAFCEVVTEGAFGLLDTAVPPPSAFPPPPQAESSTTASKAGDIVFLCRDIHVLLKGDDGADQCRLLPEGPAVWNCR